jgi:putative oxidoreductase
MLRRLRDVNLALLLLRVGMGGMMLTHGIPKLMRGPDLWPKLGKAVEHVGISEGHAVFGAAAVLAETVGAVLVILGFKTRPAAFSVFLTMVVAAAMHVGKDDGWSKVSHPLEVGIAFLAIAIAGSGKYGIDRD